MRPSFLRAAFGAALLGTLALSSPLSGCASTSQASYSGTVSDGSQAILRDGTLQVSLVETGSGTTVATESMAVGGRRMPVSFSIRPDAPLSPNGRYELRARIFGPAGELIYQSTQGVPVTASPAAPVEVVVEASGAVRPGNASL